MQSSVLLVALLCVGAALASPINSYDDIPDQYKELLPEEVAKILKDLTDADRQALKAIAVRHGEFKNEDEALAALKNESPATWEKVHKLHEMVKEKVNSLNEEAKGFAKEVIAETRKIHNAYLSGNKPSIEELKGKAKDFITKFKALSDDAKKDFEDKFPILTSVVKNEKIQAIAKQFIGTTN
ncbi:unnamed protein product, partial [Mesorhabditis spiculigera]